MELGALFSHGGAAAAAALLWRFRLLDMLLPAHAAHMQRHKSARKPRCMSRFIAGMWWTHCCRRDDQPHMMPQTLHMQPFAVLQRFSTCSAARRQHCFGSRLLRYSGQCTPGWLGVQRRCCGRWRAWTRMWTPPTQRRRSCGSRPSPRRCWLTLGRHGSGDDRRSRTLSWQSQVRSAHAVTVLVRMCVSRATRHISAGLETSRCQLSPQPHLHAACNDDIDTYGHDDWYDCHVPMSAHARSPCRQPSATGAGCDACHDSSSWPSRRHNR